MNADSYHHGDLPNALRAAAAQLIDERGPAGFSLREVARRAGVSHAAPSHHFGDTTGLLTAIAIEAFQHLTAELTAVAEVEPDPRRRLELQGRAYVETGRRYPGHCAVVFRHDLVDSTDATYSEWALRAYTTLEATITDIRDCSNPDLDVDTATKLCWSTMQGLGSLYDAMASRELQHENREIAEIGDLAELFGRMIVNGIANC